MKKKYSAIICSFMLPFLPGHSGGEIRDYHLLGRIASIADVRFISMTDARPSGRSKSLLGRLNEYWDPSTLVSRYPELVNTRALRRSWISRLVDFLRLHNIPVLGIKYHREITIFSWQMDVYVLPILKRMIQMNPPDFLFITPQLNPALMRFDVSSLSQTRKILLTYDVEAARMESMAEASKGLAGIATQIEARRAERFERDHLRIFDGVVVVSDLDKETIIDRYEMDADRILVVENSIDTDYFAFTPDTENHGFNIVFVGNFGYWPNHDAALRLLRNIMPRVRAAIPGAKAWVVGDRPDSTLRAIATPGFDFVTGQVDDVRQYLQQASLVCIPLRAGSGTKYKLLEAMSVGKPVVCTSLAAEGLNLFSGIHMLLADSDEEIANACIEILIRPEMFRKMVLDARRQVEQFYTWNLNLDKLDQWLENMARKPSSPK